MPSDTSKGRSFEHHKFRGWVPTVSGELSFSSFGMSVTPTPAITANVSDRENRYIICYQARDSSDVILPFKSFLERYFLQLDGKMWFACLARADEFESKKREVFKGYLFVYHNESLWSSHAKEKVKSAQSELKKFRFGITGESLERYFDQKFNDLIPVLAAESSFNAPFTMRRTGTTEIVVDEGMVISPNAPTWQSIGLNKNHIIHIVTAQLFFFLRDIGHRHQHHDPTTDTIVDLHRVQGADDLNWRLETLYSMYRRIISYKRDPHSEVFYASLGILGYAKSFLYICKKELKDDQFKQIPEFYPDALKQSIRAIQDEINQKQNETRENLESLRTLIIFIVGFLISLSSLVSLSDAKLELPKGSILLILAQYMVTQPIELFSITVSITISVFLLFGRIKPTEWRITKNVMRLFHSHKRSSVVIGFILTSFFFACLTLGILFL